MQSRAEIVIGLGSLWAKLHRSPVNFDGIGRLALFQQDVAKIAKTLGKVGLDTNGIAERRLGLVRPTPRGQYRAQVAEVIRIGWIRSEHLAHALNCFGVATGTMRDLPQQL